MSKPTDAWMPLYVGDYLADTGRLTMAEHGAYLLLIMDYWRSGPPPDDDARLARIVRATPEEWAGVRDQVRAMFRVDGGMLRHKRVDAELAASAARAEAQKARTASASEARRAAAQRNDERNDPPGANVTTNVTRSSSPSPSPSPSRSSSSVVPTPSKPGITEPYTVPAAREKIARAPAAKATNGVGSVIWAAYDLAFTNRYGVPATRNARSNALIAQFAQRVPAEEAPAIAQHYVASSRAVYVGARHALNLLVRDAEAVRTDWLTGTHGTDRRARETDRMADSRAGWDKLIAEVRETGTVKGIIP